MTYGNNLALVSCKHSENWMAEKMNIMSASYFLQKIPVFRGLKAWSEMLLWALNTKLPSQPLEFLFLEETNLKYTTITNHKNLKTFPRFSKEDCSKHVSKLSLPILSVLTQLFTQLLYWNFLSRQRVGYLLPGTEYTSSACLPWSSQFPALSSLDFLYSGFQDTATS